MKRLLIPLLALCILGCDAASDATARVESLNMPGTEDLGLPFSAAVRVDNLLFLSGNIGNIPGSMTLADGGIQGEPGRLSTTSSPRSRPLAPQWTRSSSARYFWPTSVNGVR